jgi:hypothetical protein
MPQPPAPLHEGHGRRGGTGSIALVYQAWDAGKAASRTRLSEASTFCAGGDVLSEKKTGVSSGGKWYNDATTHFISAGASQ